LATDIIKLLRNVFNPQDTATVLGKEVPTISTSKPEQEKLRRIGITSTDLNKSIQQMLYVGQDRRAIYSASEKSLEHPIMSGACALYADTSASRSNVTGKTLWAESKSKEYKYQIDKLFDVINLEEVLYDWVWTMCLYGDHFIKANGQPGVGIISVEDDDHPLNISRVDVNGRLIGFFQTPLGINPTNEAMLMPSWSYVHMRLLGAKRRRPMYCLSGSTKIHLLDNTSPTIKEMCDNSDKYVGKSLWSINPVTKELEVDTIESVQKTRLNAELVRVHLDNELYVDCTPDHKFMLRDGSFKKAEDLVQGESLMPFYSKMPTRGKLKDYKLVYNPGKSKWQYEHIVVVNEIYGEVTKGNIRHHVDFNKLNNEPSNLKIVTKEDHTRIHWSRKPLPRVTRSCVCGCGKTFVCICTSNQKFITGHNNKGKTWSEICGEKRAILINKQRSKTRSGQVFEHNEEDCMCTTCRTRRGDRPKHREDCNCCICKNTRKVAVLNHKVIRVERLTTREDTYDITTVKNHNFPLEVGVFVHNSTGLDPMAASEYRAMTLMTPDQRRISSKYGTGVLNDGLVAYKRLKMAEDSVMMSRLSKGMLRYVFAIGMGNNANPDAVSSIIDEYSEVLKKARSIDTAGDNAYKERTNFMSALEDIIIPVWGEVNQFKVEKIGGETDIKWIKDVEELRQHLFAALRIAPQLFGAYVEQLPGSLGQSALERLDIRFARQCRRIQRSIVSGIERLIQIHLAYQGMDPDLSQFEVKIADISTAEEEEIKNGLKTGTDATATLVEMLEEMFGDKLDKVKLVKYINDKFLKLNDFNIEDMLLDIENAGPLLAPEPSSEVDAGAAPAKEVPVANAEGSNPFRSNLNARVENSDVKAMIPIHEAKWNELYKDTKIKIES
jgi:hypothetical protein